MQHYPGILPKFGARKRSRFVAFTLGGTSKGWLRDRFLNVAFTYFTVGIAPKGRRGMTLSSSCKLCKHLLWSVRDCMGLLYMGCCSWLSLAWGFWQVWHGLDCWLWVHNKMFLKNDSHEIAKERYPPYAHTWYLFHPRSKNMSVHTIVLWIIFFWFLTNTPVTRIVWKQPCTEEHVLKAC